MIYYTRLVYTSVSKVYACFIDCGCFRTDDHVLLEKIQTPRLIKNLKYSFIAESKRVADINEEIRSLDLILIGLKSQSHLYL